MDVYLVLNTKYIFDICITSKKKKKGPKLYPAREEVPRPDTIAEAKEHSQKGGKNVASSRFCSLNMEVST